MDANFIPKGIAVNLEAVSILILEKNPGRRCGSGFLSKHHGFCRHVGFIAVSAIAPVDMVGAGFPVDTIAMWVAVFAVSITDQATDQSCRRNISGVVAPISIMMVTMGFLVTVGMAVPPAIVIVGLVVATTTANSIATPTTTTTIAMTLLLRLLLLLLLLLPRRRLLLVLLVPVRGYYYYDDYNKNYYD